MVGLETLPNDLIHEVALKLDLSDLAGLIATSWRFRDTLSSNRFWQRRFVQDNLYSEDSIPNLNLIEAKKMYCNAHKNIRHVFSKTKGNLLEMVDGFLQMPDQSFSQFIILQAVRLRLNESKECINDVYPDGMTALILLTLSIKPDDAILPCIEFGLSSVARVQASDDTSPAISLTETLVNVLFAHVPDVNIKDRSGNGALHYASMRNQPRLVNALLEAGADIEMKERGNNSALITAMIHRQTENVRILCAHGAKILEALIWTFTHNDLEMLATLLENANLESNASKQSAEIALWVAAFNNQPCIVAQFLKYNISTEYRNNKGNTALMAAVGKDHLEVVRLLVAADAKVEARNYQGEAALDLVVSDEIQTLLRNALAEQYELDQSTSRLFYASSINIAEQEDGAMKTSSLHNRTSSI